ncbi:MAG: U32 family peptidase [Peptostreptococcaceae bacterium]
MKQVELLIDILDFKTLKEIINEEFDAFTIGEGLANFSIQEIIESSKIAKENNKKMYLAFNKIPHEKDLINIEEFLKNIKDINIDGIYVIEPGVLYLVKEYMKNTKVFLSEQANVINYETASFWYNEGVRRIVLSKEMSIKDVSQIVLKTSDDLEFELIAHGSLLISHSGRKLLSNFLKDKSGEAKIDKNVKYNLVEEKREGLYFPVYEDERGTFLFNTEDMCMIEFIPELIESGIDSLKVDTRLKDTKYTIEAIIAYKKAIKEYYIKKENWEFDSEWIKNLDDINTRNYTSGFYIKKVIKTEE